MVRTKIQLPTQGVCASLCPHDGDSKSDHLSELLHFIWLSLQAWISLQVKCDTDCLMHVQAKFTKQHKFGGTVAAAHTSCLLSKNKEESLRNQKLCVLLSCNIISTHKVLS